MKLLLLTLFVAAVAATQLTWTGTGPNNLFDEPTNWQPVQRPGPGTDLTIGGNSVVLLGAARTLNVSSLTLSSSAQLTIRSPLAVKTWLVVQDQASFVADIGDSVGFVVGKNGAGGANITSSATQVVNNGYLRGQWNLGQSATLQPNSTGQIVNVESLENAGTVTVGSTVKLVIHTYKGETTGLLKCSSGSLGVFGESDDSSNAGTIVLSNCQVQGLQLKRNRGGKVTVLNGGNTIFTPFAIDNLIVQSGASLNVGASALSSGPVGRISNLVVSGQLQFGPGYGTNFLGTVKGLTGSGQVSFVSLTQVSFSDVNFQGQLACTAPGALLQFNGSAQLQSFQPVQCSFDVTGNLQITVLNLGKGAVGSSSGTGVVSATTVLINDQAVLSQNVTLQSKNIVTSIMGTVAVGGGAVVHILPGGQWSFANDTTLGNTANEDGLILVDREATLSIQPNVQVTTTAVPIQGNGTVAIGENAALNYGYSTFNVKLITIAAATMGLDVSNHARVSWHELQCPKNSTAVSGGDDSCSGNTCGPRTATNDYDFQAGCQ